MTTVEAARLHLAAFANPREAVWKAQQHDMKPLMFGRDAVAGQRGSTVYVGAVADLDGVHVMTECGDLHTVHWEDLLDGTPQN